jgi:DNA replication protein DnaC
MHNPKSRVKKLHEEVVDQDLDPALLTPEQTSVIKMIVEDGKNVFFTGSAGTGKSFVLKHLGESFHPS